MDYAEREKIFAKEVIDYHEFAKLFNITEGAASKQLQLIKSRLKKKGKLTLNIRGKIAVWDYLEYFKAPDKIKIKRYAEVKIIEGSGNTECPTDITE